MNTEHKKILGLDKPKEYWIIASIYNGNAYYLALAYTAGNYPLWASIAEDAHKFELEPDLNSAVPKHLLTYGHELYLLHYVPFLITSDSVPVSDMERFVNRRFAVYELSATERRMLEIDAEIKAHDEKRFQLWHEYKKLQGN